MTAGQIATPYRQVRISLLVAALAVTFGVGVVTGLAATRTVGQSAQTASNAGVIASSTGSGTWADRAALLGQKHRLLLAANAGVAAASTDSGVTDLRGGATSRPPPTRGPSASRPTAASRRMDRTSGWAPS